MGPWVRSSSCGALGEVNMWGPRSGQAAVGPWVRSTCGALDQVKQLWGPGWGQATVYVRSVRLGWGGAAQGTQCGAFPPKTKNVEVPKYVCRGWGESAHPSTRQARIKAPKSPKEV